MYVDAKTPPRPFTQLPSCPPQPSPPSKKESSTGNLTSSKERHEDTDIKKVLQPNIPAWLLYSKANKPH